METEEERKRRTQPVIDRNSNQVEVKVAFFMSISACHTPGKQSAAGTPPQKVTLEALVVRHHNKAARLHFSETFPRDTTTTGMAGKTGRDMQKVDK